MKQWPKEVSSRYGEYKFVLDKVMSDRAKYKVIDVETGKEEIGDRVYGTPSQLQSSADDLIKPQGATQSTNLGESTINEVKEMTFGAYLDDLDNRFVDLMKAAKGLNAEGSQEIDMRATINQNFTLFRNYISALKKEYSNELSKELTFSIDEGVKENVDKVAGGIPYRRHGNKVIISEPLDDATKERLIGKAKKHGYFAQPNQAGGITITLEKGMYEDLNDPIMVRMRATQVAKEKKAAKPTINPDYTAVKNAKKITFLKKEREQLMRDMEQEAEPEGGPIADEYGSKLNRIDKAIAKLSGRKEMTYDQAIAENKILKQAKLSSAEYQKAKKLKGFNKEDYEWNPDEGLYVKEKKSKFKKHGEMSGFDMRGINEQMDIYDEIANEEFGMDYDQLGSNEQQWVHDEIDNMPKLNEASKEEQLKIAFDALDKAEMSGDIRGVELALAAIDSIRGAYIIEAKATNKISDDKLTRLIPKMPKGYVGKNTGIGKYTISTPDGEDIVLTQSKDKKNWSYEPSNVALKILEEAYSGFLRNPEDPDSEPFNPTGSVAEFKEDLRALFGKFKGDLKNPEFIKGVGEIMVSWKSLLRSQLDEAKATCCHRCGRVHVKGTPCKRPYLKGKKSCAVKEVQDLQEMYKKVKETKSAPKGHYFTKSGNLVKGRMTKDAEERGARKSDPKDKMRSKIPKVTQYTEAVEEYIKSNPKMKKSEMMEAVKNILKTNN